MKRTVLRWIVLLMAGMMILGAAVGCSASNKAMAEDRMPSANDGASYDSDMGYVGKGDYAEDYEYSEEKPMEPPSVDGDAVVDAPAVNVEEKIIRTVEINAQTKDFDRVTAELETMARGLGGYVESSRSNGAGYSGNKNFSRYASYVFRIPSAKLEEFLSLSGELCSITSNYSNVSNVTATYYDMQSRLETLRAEQKSLQAMLEQAKDIDTMLKVQRYLYDVIAEIESYETQLRVLDSKVAYSTVTLYLSEVVEYTKDVEEETWGERLGDAFVESWTAFGEGFQSFTVWFVNAVPTLLVLGVITAGIVLSVRVAVKRRRKKQASEQELQK